MARGETNMTKHWKCVDCGQEVMAGEDPAGGIFDRWSDGHKCRFAEVKE